MNNFEMDNGSSTLVKRQLAITIQLYQAISGMRHIDEVFLWLARAIVYYFEIQGVHWWTLQAHNTGQYSTQLRSMAYQDNSIPHYIVANDRIASIVEQLQTSQHRFLNLSTDRLFSLYQANLLARYGMNFCVCYFLRNPALLLPPWIITGQEIPTPLMATLLLFTRHHLSQDMLSAIHLVLEQALAIAENHGLLTPVASPSRPAMIAAPQTEMMHPLDRPSQSLPRVERPMPPQQFQFNQQQTGSHPAMMPFPTSRTESTNIPPLQQNSSEALSAPTASYVPIQSAPPVLPKQTRSMPAKTQYHLLQLVPRRLEQVSLFPFDGSQVGNAVAVIGDKQAKRLFAAIDDQRTLDEICMELKIDLKSARQAVRFLLIQNRIELYEPGGQLVDSFPFIKL